jgi:hypothetical protein
LNYKKMGILNKMNNLPQFLLNGPATRLSAAKICGVGVFEALPLRRPTTDEHEDNLSDHGEGWYRDSDGELRDEYAEEDDSPHEIAVSGRARRRPRFDNRERLSAEDATTAAAAQSSRDDLARSPHQRRRRRRRWWRRGGGGGGPH